MIGMTSITGTEDMITPAACTPHCRFRPSRPLAVSKTSFATGSVAISSRKGAASP